MEAFGLYLLGFFGFLFFLLINKLFLEAPRILDPAMPGLAIVNVTLLEAPNFMTWSLPIGVLFATLMSMGRLAKDNELTAMFTNGISLYRLFLPFLFLSSFSVVAAYLTQEHVVTMAASLQQRIYDANPVITQREQAEPDPFIAKLDEGGFVTATFFDKEQGTLGNVVYDDWGRDEGDTLVVATRGSTAGDRLTMGTDQRSPAVLYEEPDENRLYQYHMREPSTGLELGADLRTQYTEMKTPQELTQTELAEQSRTKKQRGENPAQDETDFHLRFSGPFASLAFALVAMPLSLRAPRDERLLGLILSFILVMVYYLVYTISKLMGYNEVLPPWLAAWMMNIVFGAISLLIFITSRK
jgi:lipopolysaccharide export LptBFGC system permease protein LptF